VSSAWWRVAVGVAASVVAFALGVAVWAQSVAVALGWFLIAVVALSVPLAQARRITRARRTPDVATARHVLAILTDLDEVEHRAVELGPAWPRLSVGPTGVLVIDVCPAGASSSPARRGDVRILQGRLARAARTGLAARRALDHAGIDIPVRTLAVTGAIDGVGGVGGVDGVHVVHGAGDDRDAATPDVRVIDTTELSGALSAGPALPMAVVDAAFTSLTHTDGLVAD
jgi:hypothetical protein